MKIVHIIIAAFYKEGWGYQENILPAKHFSLGIDTYIISYNEKFPKGAYYINNDNVKISLLPVKRSFFAKMPVVRIFIGRTKGLYQKLDEIYPDIVFLHGLQSIESLTIAKWCKYHPDSRLYVDQHGDYYNMPLHTLRRRIIAKYLWGNIAKILSKYTVRFWGVTPWRVDYLQNVYGVKPDKTGLLVMGGDESLIDWKHKNRIKDEIRIKYNIPSKAFLIISGGKIDEAKNIHLLIDSVLNIDVSNVYLLIFGSMTPDMDKYCKPKFGEKIKFLGWMDSKEVYPLFLASDLAVFPGTHSVLWEQAMACGIPGIFKDWNGGFSHIDCGGNALLLKDVNVDLLTYSINLLIENKDLYHSMKVVAETKGRKEFSYIEIAKRAICL